MASRARNRAAYEAYCQPCTWMLGGSSYSFVYHGDDSFQEFDMCVLPL